MLTAVGRVVILVDDYDEALRLYMGKLGFETIVDTRAGKLRSVHIQLP